VPHHARLWLDPGDDGLRRAATNFSLPDPALRDHPAKPAGERIGRGFSPDNPYAHQYHYYNNTRPENLAFLEQLRALLDRYPGVAALGEISSEDSLATIAEYTSGRRLHMGYSFELLTDDFSAAWIRDTVCRLDAKRHEGWPCWAISNHDVERVLSRWGGGRPAAPLAKLLTAMLCSLRGAVCVYQGEELGLTEAEVPYEALRDPFGIAFWPQFKGRDGCRTPMPWNGDMHAGFTTGKPWLPVPDEHLPMAVSHQESDPDSTLHGFRTFLRWRRSHPALCTGAIRFLHTAEPVLAFTRHADDEVLLVAFNLSDRAAELTLPIAGASSALRGHGLREGTLDGNHLQLPRYGALFARFETVDAQPDFAATAMGASS
jgi:alpha-glucosidase